MIVVQCKYTPFHSSGVCFFFNIRFCVVNMLFFLINVNRMIISINAVFLQRQIVAKSTFFYPVCY